MENNFTTVKAVPKASRMVESLRDTGYDFNTAVADIIDNSISAKANKIDVHLILKPNNEVALYIADNGTGMNHDGLLNAMTYGSNEQTSVNSLSKFGMGLKTASTAFCRKLSVLSRTAGSKYEKACWDLDYIADTDDWNLKFIAELNNDEIELLEETTEGNSGTLIIWEDVDKLLSSLEPSALKKSHNKIVEHLRKHLGMTFHRFMEADFTNNPIVITLNEGPVRPIDPLCRKESNRECPAKLDQKVIDRNGNVLGILHLAAYVLPRPEDWDDEQTKKDANVSVNTQGFYIYRENRLIYSGGWLGLYSNESHVGLCRVEMSFGGELDSSLNVDIKKSTVNLDEGLANFLKNKFLSAPRNRAVEVYNSANSRKAVKRAESKGLHKLSNKTIEEKKDEIVSSSVEIIDKEKGDVKVSNVNGTTTCKIKIYEEPKNDNCRVIVKEKEDDTYLFQPAIVNGEHAVELNASNGFYRKVYSKLDKDSAAALDYFFWSSCEAELTAYTAEAKNRYKAYRHNIFEKLNILMETIPEPDLEDDD